MSKRSSWTNHDRARLTSIVFATSNSPNLAALHSLPQMEIRVDEILIVFFVGTLCNRQ